MSCGLGLRGCNDSSYTCCACDDDETYVVRNVLDELEVDYDKNVTELYQAIEDKIWDAVGEFLRTGMWPGRFFSDKTTIEEQARTWVTRFESRNGTRYVRWSHLPLHAAIIRGAPPDIVYRLMKANTKALRSTNSGNLLPIHLAFRHGSPDTVLAMLLDEYPESLNYRGANGKFAVEYASNGPNPYRGYVIQTILQNNNMQWKRKIASVQEQLAYCFTESTKIKHQRVAELKAELHKVREKQKMVKNELSSTINKLERKTGMVISNVDQRASSPMPALSKLEGVKPLVERLDLLNKKAKELVKTDANVNEKLRALQKELEYLQNIQSHTAELTAQSIPGAFTDKREDKPVRFRMTEGPRVGNKEAQFKLSYDEEDHRARTSTRRALQVQLPDHDTADSSSQVIQLGHQNHQQHGVGESNQWQHPPRFRSQQQKQYQKQQKHGGILKMGRSCSPSQKRKEGVAMRPDLRQVSFEDCSEVSFFEKSDTPKNKLFYNQHDFAKFRRDSNGFGSSSKRSQILCAPLSSFSCK